MDGRSVTVQTTRRRIVDAAMALHAERGSRATSWDDIASKSGVSRATIYHHFPSLDKLVPDCAQVAFELIDVPTPDQARRALSPFSSFEARIHHFSVETCRCYAAGAEWLRAAWRERDLVPAMGAAVERLEHALQVLLSAVLHDMDLGADDRRVVTTLLAFPFWESLRRDGMRPERIPAHIESLVHAVVASQSKNTTRRYDA
jgi:AcrR family transcriptional regulator